MNEAVKHDAHVEEYLADKAREIFALALAKGNVFFSYSPHTSGLNVRIYKDGWKENSNPEYDATVYLDWTNSGPESINAILSAVQKA